MSCQDLLSATGRAVAGCITSGPSGALFLPKIREVGLMLNLLYPCRLQSKSHCTTVVFPCCVDCKWCLYSVLWSLVVYKVSVLLCGRHTILKCCTSKGSSVAAYLKNWAPELMGSICTFSCPYIVVRFQRLLSVKQEATNRKCLPVAKYCV